MPVFASFARPSNQLPQNSVPLIGSTPPAIAAALNQIYPFVVFGNYVLALITWTHDDGWASFLLVALYVLLVQYIEALLKYFGQLMVAIAIVCAHRYLKHSNHKHGSDSLETTTFVMSQVATRLEILLSPLAAFNLSDREATRFIMTSLLTSPVYALIATLLSARRIVQILGVLVLTYHSLWARLVRAVLWRWRPARTFTFYWTGVDFGSRGQDKELREAVSKSLPQDGAGSRSSDFGSGDDGSGKTTADASTDNSEPHKPKVQFTFTLYENQRNWLGQGWTTNMLAYERASWTDELLNETQSTDTFQLPQTEGTGLCWRWVDATWGVDLSNGGLLNVEGDNKIDFNPESDDGFVYYDNLWRKPSAIASYSKYTRRRKWVRTAELVSEDAATSSPEVRGAQWAAEYERVAGVADMGETRETNGTGAQISSAQLRRRQ